MHSITATFNDVDPDDVMDGLASLAVVCTVEGTIVTAHFPPDIEQPQVEDQLAATNLPRPTWGIEDAT